MGIKYIRKFLLLNGFTEKGTHVFKNDKCTVTVDGDCYEVIFIYIDEEASLTSHDLSIYWLVGVLTWYDLMPKEYVEIAEIDTYEQV
jgi:hypothetical protein